MYNAVAAGLWFFYFNVFCSENLTWNSWELKSLGQISLSPQKGLTVIVFSSSTGKLSLNPPSMYRMPWKRGGSIPENTGTKHDARTAWEKKHYCILCLVLSDVGQWLVYDGRTKHSSTYTNARGSTLDYWQNPIEVKQRTDCITGDTS